jgi:hypothetical protein
MQFFLNRKLCAAMLSGLALSLVSVQDLCTAGGLLVRGTLQPSLQHHASRQRQVSRSIGVACEHERD